jgi:hypothetical protein
MTLDSKQDLDALLRRWPALAPSKERGVVEHEDNADWEGRADAIVRAAAAAGPSEATVLAALEAPPLPAEAGELERASARGTAGDKKMSEENESGGSPTNRESSSAPRTSTASPERKRTSLKAIAERASQSGSRPSATPISAAKAPASTPSTTTPIPSRPALASRPSIPNASVSRPVEAGSEDSGVINLNTVNASATPEQVAAAEKAQPGSVGLFEDEKPAVAAAPTTAKSADIISIAAKVNTKKRSNGALAGLSIAVLGVAAAFAIMKVQKPEPAAVAPPPASTAVVVAEAKPTPPAPAEAPSPVAVATAAPTVEASAAPEKGEAPRLAAASPGGSPATATATAAPKEAPVDTEEKVAQVEKPAAPTGKDGDLHSEIVRAAGGQNPQQEAAGGTPEPAAGNPRAQSIPEQPAQGSVASAVNTVMGGAKACVGGADDVSRANVTFSSNGTVSNVTVTGWAASNGKADCIKAALKGAKVGPFSKANYTFSVTIRP